MGKVRDVRRERGKPDPFGNWSFQDEHDAWRPYDAGPQAQIVAAKAADRRGTRLYIGRRAYWLDFKDATQTNTATGVKRKLELRMNMVARASVPGPTGKATCERYPVRADLALCGVQLEASHFAPSFDKFYVDADHPKANKTKWQVTWRGALKGSRTADLLGYFCPANWRRFSLDVSIDDETFSKSSIMYHGTIGENALPIVRDGFKPRECQHGVTAVYLTPSICYAAHPRYARVYKSQEGCYFQVVLEVRVLNELVNAFKGETMRVSGPFMLHHASRMQSPALHPHTMPTMPSPTMNAEKSKRTPLIAMRRWTTSTRSIRTFRTMMGWSFSSSTRGRS